MYEFIYFKGEVGFGAIGGGDFVEGLLVWIMVETLGRGTGPLGFLGRPVMMEGIEFEMTEGAAEGTELPEGATERGDMTEGSTGAGGTELPEGAAKGAKLTKGLSFSLCFAIYSSGLRRVLRSFFDGTKP